MTIFGDRQAVNKKDNKLYMRLNIDQIRLDLYTTEKEIVEKIRHTNSSSLMWEIQPEIDMWVEQFRISVGAEMTHLSERTYANVTPTPEQLQNYGIARRGCERFFALGTEPGAARSFRILPQHMRPAHTTTQTT